MQTIATDAASFSEANTQLDRSHWDPMRNRPQQISGNDSSTMHACPHDDWYSCHSCHTDGHTTGEIGGNTLGDGHYGAPKRIMTLLGVCGLWTLGLEWKCRAA